MPPIRYYTVEQTRQIEVRAIDPVDAVIIARAKFDGREKPDNIFGSSGEIRIRGLEVKEID